MMRSMYSAVSGLKTHQTKMDVIGNNIANVNTFAFKSSAVTFSEIMYQTISSASGANEATGTGGINAKQIGLGVTTGATNVSITSSGAAQTTGNAFDIRLTDANSTNFFVVNNGSENLFTRAGSFYVDGSGNLCMTSTGYTVMGWQVQTDPMTGERTIKKDTDSALKVMSADNMTSAPEETTKAYVAGILDKNTADLTNGGLTMTLNFTDKLGYTYTAKFNIVPTSAGSQEKGDYTVSLTDIIDQNNESCFANGKITGNKTAVFADTKLKFNPDNGTFDYVNAAGTNSVTMNLAGTWNDQFSDITVDFSACKMDNNNKQSTISAKPGTSSQDTTGKGKKLGALTGLSVDTSGKIWGTYDNGNTELLCQIASAQFANASGLEKVGENCYTTTLNSGDFDGIGTEITADGSKMTSGQLEMSNVDLSTEFTDMITTQRGFQANSRIITTSDTLLEELVNLKR